MFSDFTRKILQIAGIALAVGATASLWSSPARGDSAGRTWTEGLARIGTCGTTLDAASSVDTRCFLDRSFNRVLDEGTRFADEYGKTVFGQHFQLVGNLAYSAVPNQTGLVGDLDAVIPFLAGGEHGVEAEGSGSALFLQQGVTRWWDGSGSNSLRNDLRHGLVYRFRISDELDADIIGISMFHLTNVEQRHEVLAPAIDYTGRWGTASLRYFSPTTGWQTRAGRTERALEGMELAMGLDLTSTLRVNTTGYRWESEDGSGEWTRGVRLDVGWRPHPWLHLGAGYGRTTGGEDALSFLAGLRIPFGSRSKPPRWEGLGLAAGGSAPRTTDLWRPTEGIGRIRVATRATVDGIVGDAQVRFLQDTVGSGGAVQLEIVLPAAAPQDIRVAVRLVPGSGDNPAVPGEDFVDEPVETTIPQGARTGRVSVQLLRNEGMQESRSLGATVSVVS